MDSRSDLLVEDTFQRLPDDTPSETRQLLMDAVHRERELRHTQVVRQRTESAPVRDRRPAATAVMVGLSTLVGSAIPLLPFIVLPVSVAAPLALLLGGLALFLAGMARARRARTRGARA